MICQRHIPILRIIPGAEHTSDAVSTLTNGDWATVHVAGVVDVLRLMRLHRPNILVIDLCDTHFDTNRVNQHDDIVGIIPAVRRRVPGVPVVVLGPSQDRSVEHVVRCMGVTAYLPVGGKHSRDRARRAVEALHQRDDPAQVHGPPARDGPTAIAPTPRGL